MIEKIKEKINELESLGKDQSEINLWKKLLPNMTVEEQTELLDSLEKELELIKEK